MQRTMLVAVQATDCTSVSDANFCPSSIFFIGPKNDNHWGPSSDCMAGVVMPQSPVVPQSLECGRALSCNRITLCVSSPSHFVRIAVLSLSSKLQYDDAFSSTVFLKLNKQYSSHVPEHGRHHFVCWGHNFELGRSRLFFVFPLPWSLLCLLLIVMNPGLINRYNQCSL